MSAAEETAAHALASLPLQELTQLLSVDSEDG